MQTLTQSIFIGVASGVITSSLLFLIVQLFKKSFMPWFQQSIYQGVNISGKWQWIAEGYSKAQMELKQHAGKITGIYTIVTLCDSDKESIRTYSVSGEIVDRLIQLNLRNNNPAKLGAMAFLLEVVGDGSQLKGYCSSYDITDHQIHALAISFFRTEVQAKSYSKNQYQLPEK